MTENFQENVFISKNAPIIDYKNISLLKNILRTMEKLFHQKITSISFNKQKNLLKKSKKLKF